MGELKFDEQGQYCRELDPEFVANKPSPSSSKGSQKSDSASKKSNDIAFVNITNPSESSSHANRKFVRRFVKLKRGKNDNASGHEGSPPQPAGEDPIRPTELEGGAWPFIGISHPSQASAPQSLRFVRQQAQKKHQRLKGEGKKSQKKKESAREAMGKDVVVRLRSPSPLSTFVGNEKTIYPMAMNSEAYEIVSYLHGDYDKVLIRNFARRLWFGAYLKDEAAFQQLIGISLYAKSMYVSGTNPYEKQTIAYHVGAMQSVQKRLSDPDLRTSPGVMLGILSLVSHDTIILDFESYKINISGLARIVELRGGLQTLDDHADIRFVILWVDVKAAYTFDIPPTFVVPESQYPIFEPPRIAPLPSPLLLRTYYTWNSRYPSRQEVLKAFQDLYVLNSGIKYAYHEMETNYSIMGHASNTLVKQFMCPTVNGEAAMSGSVVEKALRLASLLYIDRLREAFSEVMIPLIGYQFITRLLAAVQDNTDEWDGFEELRLWAAVVGGSIALPQHKGAFVQVCRRSVKLLEVEKWEAAMQILEDVLWIGQIFRITCEDFGAEVMGY